MLDDPDQPAVSPMLPEHDFFSDVPAPAKAVRPAGGPDLPLLATVDEGFPIGRDHQPVLVRTAGGRRKRDALEIDYPFPHNRSGRKRRGVDVFMSKGPLGLLLLRAVVQQCSGKSPDGWKMHLDAVAIVLKALDGRQDGFQDAGALPADILQRVEDAAAADGRGLTSALRGNLRGAHRVIRRLAGSEHVLGAAASSHSDAGFEAPAADDFDGPTDVEVELLITHAMAKVVEVMAAEAQIEASGVGEGPLTDEVVVCVRFMRREFPGGPPALDAVDGRDAGMSARMRAVGYDEVVRRAYPTPRDMVPFIILLAFYTRLNPTVLCGMLLDHIGEVSIFGRPVGVLGDSPAARLELNPPKPRAGRAQHVSFPITAEDDNPDGLIRFVRRWTAGIRKVAGRSAGNLFIYAVKGRTAEHPTFRHSGGQFVLAQQMASLCRQSGIRAMSPKQLRPAAVDALFQESGGDMALVRASGWWRSVTTPELVYLGPRTRRRGEEDLGHLQLLERRRRDFGIDVASRADWMDRGAATPGWICYDPFRGPLRQKPGELCSAVGRCPLCPNSDLDEKSPAVFTWIVALGLALLAKRGTLSPEQWRAQWEPVVDSLVLDWIPLFADDVVEEARALPAVEMEDF